MDSAVAVLIAEEEVVDHVARLRRAALSDETRERYTGCWNRYVAWCAEQGLDAMAVDGRQLVVWLGTRFHDVRPGTLRNDANGVARHVRFARGVDLMLDVNVNRILWASTRRHGAAPNPANVVMAFTRDELVAMVAAPIGYRGMVNDDVMMRGIAAVLLFHLGVPMRQVVRADVEAVVSGSPVVVELPEVAGPGVEAGRRLAARTLTIHDAVIDAEVLVDLAAVPVARRRLFAVACEGAKKGRYTQAVTVAGDATPRGIAGALRSQLRGAARRAGLELDDPEELARWSEADVVRLVRFMNPAHLVELRTRVHAATLAALGARHDDVEHVKVEKMRKRVGGWELRIEQTKTDQDGVGHTRLVPHTQGHPPTCPACLITRWLEDARLESGPLFPSLTVGGRAKATAVAVEEAAGEFQRLAARLGIEGKVGTHSFRKTHVTLRAANGEEAWQIARTTRQSPGVVHRNYVDRGFDTTAQL